MLSRDALYGTNVQELHRKIWSLDTSVLSRDALYGTNVQELHRKIWSLDTSVLSRHKHARITQTCKNYTERSGRWIRQC